VNIDAYLSAWPSCEVFETAGPHSDEEVMAAVAAGEAAEEILGRGLHSLTLEINLSNPRAHSRGKLGHTVDIRAQVELKSERV